MNKLVSEGQSAMDKILQGVNLVANPVKASIGPVGRTSIISESIVANYDIQNYPIIISKDGFRISESITAADPEVNVGVRLIQEAARKQMADCGDGTSSVCLLTQFLLDGGLKLIQDGANHVEVIKGINAAVEYVVEELIKMSTPIDGDVEKILQIATLTSNGDTVIGNLIAEAFEKMGKDGIIKLEEAKGTSTTIKISDGIKFNRGWASPYFVTNKSKLECELVNPYILIYDRPITILKDLMPVLQQVFDINTATGIKRPLMVFCDACDGEPLATLTFNNAQNNLQSCVVEMGFLGDKKREFMEDIAAATGGIFINELKGVQLENVKIEQLGQAKKIVIGKDETVIIDGDKDEEIYTALVESLKELEKKEDETESKELLKKRIARLKGAVAILSVGATTDVEMKEKKDRADDAVHAVSSALEEGYVVGGGMAFLRATLGLILDVTDNGKNNEDVIRILNQTGSMLWSSERGFNDKYTELVFAALQKPIIQICENAGIDSTDILNQLRVKNFTDGYNARTGEIEDLVENGIIEPTKSNRCAIQNAASVVCAILSSKFMITDTL